MTKVITFHSLLSTVLSFVATSLLHQGIEFSYHNSSVMPKLAIHMQTFCFKLLEQGYIATRMKSSLQKFYGSHHELVDRYSVSNCTMKTDLFNMSVFLSSFVYPGLDFLCATRGFFQKSRECLPYWVTGPCSQFSVESKFLICFCYFVCINLVILCSLLCVSIFNVFSLSLGCIHLISTKIIVPLIFLSFVTINNKKQTKFHFILQQRFQNKIPVSVLFPCLVYL